MRKIVEPYGDIKRLSLAVVVDGKYEKVKGQKGEESRYSPRSQKELNDIKNLVARAVGFNEDRGDKLEVLSAPFETEGAVDEKGFMEISSKKEMLYDIGKYVFYLTILLSVFIFVVKPLMGILKDRGGSIAMRQVGGINDLYTGAGAKSATKEAGLKEGIEAPPVLSKAQPAFASALQDKALVKSVIKEWVREGT
jgi:flagellar M-ring protein FliF